MSERRVYIRELANELDRRESTIRGWCRPDPRDGTTKLPAHLLPLREKTDKQGGWRYWTEAQVDQIKHWMVKNNMFPGAGLRNFSPAPGDVDDLLAKLRGRKDVSEREAA